jgi:hypothetical protein
MVVVVVTMLYTEIDELEHDCSQTNDRAEFAISIICCRKAIGKREANSITKKTLSNKITKQKDFSVA